MPEILPDHVPSPRTLLAWDGTAYRPVAIDALGQLQVDVAASTVPGGIATAANQIGIAATLGVIDDLVDALQSNAADRLIVRGEDQLFSYKEALHDRSHGAVSGAGGYRESGSPLDGEIWHVTNIATADSNTALTALTVILRSGGNDYYLEYRAIAFAAGEWSRFPCDLYLEHDDVIRIWFTGSLAPDLALIDLLGYKMTVET